MELLKVPESRDRESVTSIASHAEAAHLLLKPVGDFESRVTPQSGCNDLRKQDLKHRGWRRSARIIFWIAGFILLINTGILVYAAILPKSYGLSVVYTGDCNRVNTSATSLHILINILSSILLGASNYIMQCMSAPTRNDIDSAHSKGQWMEIGSSSIKNLFIIRRRRSYLWLLLVISSIPLHLFYNAAVSKTLSANFYDVITVTSRYVKEHSEGANLLPILDATNLVSPDFQASSTTGVKNLSNSECIHAFGRDLVSDYGRVILVSEADNSSSYLALLQDTGFDMNYTSYYWMCKFPYQDCNMSELARNPANWTIYVWNEIPILISYCLAQQVEPSCRLEISVQVMSVVVCCNILKVVAIFMAMRMPGHMLLSIGDAIESFLDRPDPTTKDSCLLSMAHVRSSSCLDHAPKEPLLKPKRVSSALSMPQTISWLLLWISMCALATLFFFLGTRISPFYSGLFAPSKFGGIDTRVTTPISVTLGPAGFMKSSFLANLPQLLLSIFYVIWNNCFTSMQVASEYSKFATKAKSLRLTTPDKSHRQRSTYWLSLPLRYSVPMIAINSTLHWLTSLSIFPIQINVRNRSSTGGVETEIINKIGFSLAPILTGLVIGAIITIISIIFSCRRVSSHMPVAGNCSLAISAACHRPDDDGDAALKPVQWGDVSDPDAEYGHCCFTSKPVRPLQVGRKYL